MRNRILHIFVCAVAGSSLGSVARAGNMGIAVKPRPRRYIMRCSSAVMTILLLLLTTPTAKGITFGEWATSQGYSPGDAMPAAVDANSSSIDSLDGLQDYNWTATPTTSLELWRNQLSTIDANAFSGMTALTDLLLFENQIASIEEGAFSDLENLRLLHMSSNQLTNIDANLFDRLSNLNTLLLQSNQLMGIEPQTFSELSNLGYLELNWNQIATIRPGTFDGLPHLRGLELGGNRITRVESDSFRGLTELKDLHLQDNRIVNIEDGAFRHSAGLLALDLERNSNLVHLNFTSAHFGNLRFWFGLSGSDSIRSVSLQNAVLSQDSLATLLDGKCRPDYAPTCTPLIGIGELPGITELDLSGIDFNNIFDLSPLYPMDDLTDLWLVGTTNMNALELDVLLDELDTMQAADVEGVLYMTQADYDAFNIAGGGLLADWNIEPGHHVRIIPEPTTLTLLVLATGLVSGISHWRGNRPPQEKRNVEHT